MHDSGPCPYCGEIGFIRVDHMLLVDYETILLHCDACHRSWSVEPTSVASRDGVASSDTTEGRQR